jgi:hypothetical protein
MTLRPNPVPIRPDFSDARSRPSDHLIRAVAAVLLQAIDWQRADVGTILKHRWPRDETAELLTRAAISPATTSTAGWADTLASVALADLVTNLGPQSAASALFARGIQLSFDANAAVYVPGITASASAAFVAEGAPYPVRKLDTSLGVLLEPHSVGVIATFTRQSLLGSNVEKVVRATLTDAVAATVDVIAFDAQPGTATRPPGLRYSVSGQSASTETPAGEAMLADIAALGAAVAPVAANGPIVIVASPAQALRLRMADVKGIEVLASNGIAAGTVVAIAANALAAAVDPAPRIDVSKTTVLHEEDTAPTALSAVGTPNMIAAPTRSLWQTDTIGLRLRMEISWGLRSSTGIAWMPSTTW